MIRACFAVVFCDAWLAQHSTRNQRLPKCACRSAIPVVVCILSMLIMNKYPSRQEATALVVLTLGVMLAVWQGAVTGKPYAVFFCIAGTICNGAMMTFSNKLLRCVLAHATTFFRCGTCSGSVGTHLLSGAAHAPPAAQLCMSAAPSQREAGRGAAHLLHRARVAGLPGTLLPDL